MVLLPTFFKPGQKLTVRSFLAQGPRGVISFRTQGSDLTPFSFISSPMTWHLCFILEGSEEASVEETSSSVSEDGGEHPLGVERMPPPVFRIQLSSPSRVESLLIAIRGVLHI